MAHRLWDIVNGDIYAANTHFDTFEEIVHSPLSDERVFFFLWPAD